MLNRNKYVDLIRPYFDTDDIKILTGIRRCGKSTLLMQIKNELQGDNTNIISYNFEDYDDSMYCSNPREFYNEIKAGIDRTKKNYVFIDEVHYLEDYEKIVASIRSSLGCSVFITDSSSSLLKGDIATRFTGRSISFQIMPFSFAEFVQITGMKGKEALDYYLIHGGMPAQYENKKLDSVAYLGRLYKSILERDILQRHEIKNKWQFERIASYVLRNSGDIISASSIVKYLKKENQTCTVPTLNSYCSYLQEAFLTTECKRLSLSGKQVLETYSKNYAVDTGFISIQENTGNINLGLMLETVVHNELISRGYEVYIGKTYNGEIDFCAKKGKDYKYYQVAYDLTKEETQEREFNAYNSVKDSYPKYVISTDTIDYSRNGIKHLNIIDFLLDKD